MSPTSCRCSTPRLPMIGTDRSRVKRMCTSGVVDPRRGPTPGDSGGSSKSTGSSGTSPEPGGAEDLPSTNLPARRAPSCASAATNRRSTGGSGIREDWRRARAPVSRSVGPDDRALRLPARQPMPHDPATANRAHADPGPRPLRRPARCVPRVRPDPVAGSRLHRGAPRLGSGIARESLGDPHSTGALVRANRPVAFAR